MAFRPETGMAMPPPQTGMRTAMGTGLGTAMGGAGAYFGGGVREGKNTEMIYTMIRDGKYHEAISVLSSKLMEFPSSRAAASLLAYCYYYVSDYQNALQMCVAVHSPNLTHPHITPVRATLNPGMSA